MEQQTKTSKNRTAKRRRLDPDTRRDELLDAAIRALREKGPENIRVEDVTAMAGAAKGTFYLYFPSWNDLLIAIRAHILSVYITNAQTHFEAHDSSDWWALFELECERFIDFILELGELHAAIFHGPIADIPIESPLSSGEFISHILKRGIASGSCRQIEIDIASKYIFTILHTTADCIVQTGERTRYLVSMFDLLHSWLQSPVPLRRKRK